MNKTNFLKNIREQSAYSFVRLILKISLILFLLIIIIGFAISVPSAIWTGRSRFNSTSTAINTSIEEKTPSSKTSSDEWHEKYSEMQILINFLFRIIISIFLVLIYYFLYQCSLTILDIGDATMHTAYILHITALRSSKEK